MGKTLALLGVIFGVIGFLAAVGIFLTLSGIPGQLKDFAFVELDKTRVTLTNVDNVTTSVGTAFDELKSTVSATSKTTRDTVDSMVLLGFGIEKLADDLKAISPLLDVTKLKDAATTMKKLDSSNVTQASGNFNTKIDELKESISKTSTAINGTKTSVIRLKSTIEDVTSSISRVILLLGAFLAMISLALLVSSYNAYTKEK